MVKIEEVRPNVWKIDNVVAHNLSGDHNSFSPDCRYLALLEDGAYVQLDLEKLTYNHNFVSRNLNGSVNENWMWGPTGSSYLYLDGFQLKFVDNGEIIDDALLQPSINGRYIQWRSGSASGYEIQFIKGYTQNPEESYIQPFNVKNGFIEWMPGFWIGDISNDGNRVVRNIVRYQSGFLASLRIDAAMERYFNLDGSGYHILEPLDGIGNPAISHPTTNLVDMISGRSSYGAVDKWKFNKQSNTIVSIELISQKRFKDITGLTDFVSWHHGCMNDKYCLFSTIVGSKLDAIYVMDNEGKQVHRVSKIFEANPTGKFKDYPRPSISQNPDKDGYYWGCWHEKGGVVYLARLDMIREEPELTLEQKIELLSRNVENQATEIAELKRQVNKNAVYGNNLRTDLISMDIAHKELIDGIVNQLSTISIKSTDNQDEIKFIKGQLQTVSKILE